MSIQAIKDIIQGSIDVKQQLLADEHLVQQIQTQIIQVSFIQMLLIQLCAKELSLLPSKM
jgi:hypothetical protein